MQELEIFSEDMNRVSYVTVFDTRAGDFKVNLVAKHTVLGIQQKAVNITVLPS